MKSMPWITQCRYAAKWAPDSEFIKQFDNAVMYPDPVTSKWKIPPYNAKIAPVTEVNLKNLTINFGPQHPAAHGMENDNFSFIIISYLNFQVLCV